MDPNYNPNYNYNSNHNGNNRNKEKRRERTFDARTKGTNDQATESIPRMKKGTAASAAPI